MAEQEHTREHQQGQPSMQNESVDLAIVGGGLAGALTAWRIAETRPDVKIALIEQGETLGGNHTWSFHESDVPSEIASWLDKLVVHSWPRQEVRFPKHTRTLETGYRSITSERLHDVVAPALGDRLILGVRAADVDADGVTLEDQRRIKARAVLDVRGQRGNDALTLGFQKFLGQEIRFKKPHGVTTPIIMDATVSQSDGYRFVYVLPFSENVALIEDTYYADGASLDRDKLRQQIKTYCADKGWEIQDVLREEEGILPIALAGDIDAHLEDGVDGVSMGGLSAGLFHPLTGYSLPDAARLADLVANASDVSGSALFSLTRAHAKKRWSDRAFYRMLSRFLFYAARPDGRHKVLQRFYRLPPKLIERFYSSGSTNADKLRVLVGKPPVSFLKAIQSVNEKHWRDYCWAPGQNAAE
ncbi:MAG: lycopene beta-cyclase CrtY [Pseudomonadota bacterium]